MKMGKCKCDGSLAKYKHNKAFKSDSQRLAFFIPSLSSVFTVVRLVSWSRCSHLNAALVLDWHHGKFFGVYRVLFLSLHLVKCNFHVLSGGTI